MGVEGGQGGRPGGGVCRGVGGMVPPSKIIGGAAPTLDSPGPPFSYAYVA